MHDSEVPIGAKFSCTQSDRCLLLYYTPKFQIYGWSQLLKQINAQWSAIAGSRSEMNPIVHELCFRAFFSKWKLS